MMCAMMCMKYRCRLCGPNSSLRALVRISEVVLWRVTVINKGRLGLMLDRHIISDILFCWIYK